MKSLFEYDQYRTFLKDYIATKPKRGWGVMKNWAKALSLNPTFLSQVFTERKNLSSEQALALAQLLKLSPLEIKFFLLLLQRERSGTHQLKQYFTQEIEEIRKLRLKASAYFKSDHILKDEEKAKYYSSWIYSAIRIFCSIGDGKSHEQVAERFYDYNSSQINEAIDFLIKTKLCDITIKNKITVGPAIIFIDRNSPFFFKHNSNWRLRAMTKLDHISDKELMLTMPFSVSYKSFDKIAGELMHIFKDALEEAKNSEPQDLACLNIDFFLPLSRKASNISG
jgi:uncharacterized protein (TIGR02147 family)